MSRGGAWTILILLLVFLYLPFLGKAFHVDDRIYLETAKNILEKPLFPYDYPTIFEGLYAPDAASHSHLPLTSYILSLVYMLAGGGAEWPFHLAFLVFPAMAAWSFLDLSAYLVRRRTAGAALLISAPAFLVLGHTLMPDVPLLALWLLALSRTLRIRRGEEGRWDRTFLVVAFLGAGFISLLTFGLLMLIAAYVWMTRREGEGSRRFWLLVLAAPLLLWLGWYLRAYFYYDRFVLINTWLHMSQRESFDWALLGTKAVSFVLNVGAVFLFPVSLWLGFKGPWKTRFAALTFFVSLIPFYALDLAWEWPQVLLFGLFLASGLLVCWTFLEGLSRYDAEAWLLGFWFFGILVACLLLFYAGSVRYVLLALPPVILLWLRRIESGGFSPVWEGRLVWGTVAATVIYGLSLAYADFQWAEVYRKAARQIQAEYGDARGDIWFTGEWGFRHYLELEGARLIQRVQTDAVSGDYIVKPFVASPWVTLYDGDPYSRLVEQKVVRLPFPIRLADFSSHAGFYSTAWGLLPWSLETGEDWEWFNIFRVEREYDGPIPEEERHW